MARDVDHELVSLAVVVTVVTVVWVGCGFLVSVWLLVQLIWASSSQLQHLLLKRPRISGILGKGRYNPFIGIFRPPIKIAFQLLPMPVDDREIVGLHPLRPGIPDLVSFLVSLVAAFPPFVRSTSF